MTDCPECARLREECGLAVFEYVSCKDCKDELAMIQKTDRSFAVRRRAFERAQGRLRECHSRETHHRDAVHSSNRWPSEAELEQKLAGLQERIERSPMPMACGRLFSLLAPYPTVGSQCQTEVVEQLLTFLRNDEIAFGT
jgi:hypothetical protein